MSLNEMKIINDIANMIKKLFDIAMILRLLFICFYPLYKKLKSFGKLETSINLLYTK